MTDHAPLPPPTAAQRRGISWLSVCVALFTGLYLQLSVLGFASLLSLNSVVFLLAAALLAALLLDLPAVALQRYLSGRIGGSEQNPTSAADVLGTFIKAGQVILAFAATKAAFSSFFL